MILIISHSLTGEQIKKASEKLGVNEFINLSEKLQIKWSNVPPNLNKLNNYLSDIKEWIEKISRKGDYIFVQGEFGATYIIINYSFAKKLIPIYATTKRVNKEKVISNKVINEKIFEHIKFRKYEKYLI
jgi:hypothetical protein